MSPYKKGGVEKQEQDRYVQDVIFCQRCAVKMLPKESTWEEDGEGFLCQVCRAENESCGCSG